MTKKQIKVHAIFNIFSAIMLKDSNFQNNFYSNPYVRKTSTAILGNMQKSYLIISLILAIFFININIHAQTGTIRGNITDGASGEKLIGATVRLVQDGTVKGGAYSDLEGSYTIKTAPGTYNLIISYTLYVNDTISGVVVAAGQTVVNETLLFENIEMQKELEVVITAKRDKASSVTLYNIKRNATNSIDGVTLDLVKRAGDQHAAAAVRRVVGVTVEGGKYVYVRGLGDRYSKTLLNGAELPGLDPNRNTVQMDLFPSNLLDQIIVYKNFTPDLPGSFSGGLVDVRTKDFPDQLTISASASLGYNTQASLQENFLADAIQAGESFGVANDIRNMPSFIANDLNGVIPSYPGTRAQLQANGPTLEKATRAFQTDFLPVRRNSGLNQNYELSLGNQHLIGEKQKFGYIASLSYRRNYNYFQGGLRNQYSLPGATSTVLDPQALLTGDRGEDEILWGGLVKLSYKLTNHKFSVNYMHNQSSSSYGESFSGAFLSSGGDITLETRSAGFIERSIDVGQIQGDHQLGILKADWIVSLSKANQYEPDLRLFANEIQDDGGSVSYLINNGNGYDNPLRFYREMTEDNLDAKLNLELPFKGIATDDKGKIKFGGAFTQKVRDFGESRFELARGRNARQYHGDVADYTAKDNLFAIPLDEKGDVVVREWYQGLYYLTRTLRSNLFEAEQDIFAGYLMAELPIGPRLRVIGGARYETTDMQIFPDDSTLFDPILQVDPTANPGVLSLNDVLPSISFIYKVQNEIDRSMNIRAGYSRTLARPSIFEFSQFERLPYIGGPIYLGNPLLKRTLIDNYDLRWEWFYSLSELVSVSAFYKNFQNPIELAQDFRTQNLRFQYVNRDEAFIYGIELELKKNFGFITDGLSKLQLGANASFVYSETTLTEQEKENILAVDPTRETTRPLFGQSPYVFNAELAYIDKEELNLQASASLNVFGPRLFAVGGAAPDIYEQPRPALNISVAKGIGKYLTVRVRANNLLDPEYKFVQEFKGEEFIFRNNRVGRSFSVSLGFNM